MAEIILRKKGSKKAMPRVDLTPMVDLGFLLITFFIITTSMRKPQAMSYNTPANGSPTTIAESKTLNLVLIGQNRIMYYQGNDSLQIQTCNYHPANGLRKIIEAKQIQVEKLFGKKAETLILIKPTTKSTYKNIVETMDEMLINNVKHYMVVNATSYEEQLAH